MKNKMKLIALRDFTPDGSLKLKKGDTFEMSETSGRFLIATHRARVDGSELAELEPKVKAYKRRDMRAEK